MSATGPDLKVDDMLPGTKYRIVKSLGAGGMGVVYQVVKPPNIQGVLKLMSSELTRHEEHRMRFFDEVRILAQLDHPNIVRVFDYDALPDGTPFYVMELLTGRTVRDVIHTMGRVPPRVAYEITRQLLEALQAAHTHEVPVIHRDIKPENIFLHAPRHGEPVVKLIDFGVSAVADRKHDGAFVGTWSYAAPEQIRGERPTPATDLYATGLVLYEMLAGVGPFDHHEEWTRVSEAQLKEIPALVSKRAPWVPPSIVSLIHYALAKDPRMRPRDAYAFAERLFELEWASDGKDPHDFTMEGPSSDDAMARVQGLAAENRAAREGGPGPLSRVLSTVTSAQLSSKNMAAASPATDRLGDVPLIGVPPEAVRTGSTWRGVGGRDHTSPDTDSLLAGLDPASVAKPPSKRERASNPDAHSPRSGQVEDRALAAQVVRSPRTPNVTPLAGTTATLDEPPSVGAGAGAASGGVGTGHGGVGAGHGAVGGTAVLPVAAGEPTVFGAAPAPRAAAAGAAAPRAAAASRDTFSSQQSDARLSIPRSRTGLFLLAAVLLGSGLAIATVVVARGSRNETTATAGGTVTQAVATNASAAPASAPSAVTTAAMAAAPNVTASAVATASGAPSSAPLAAPAKAAKPSPASKASGVAAPSGHGASAPPSGSKANGQPPATAPTATASGDFIRVF